MKHDIHFDPDRAVRIGPGARLKAAFRTWLQRARLRRRIRRTVVSLEELDDRTLRDIGLRRDDIRSAVRDTLRG